MEEKKLTPIRISAVPCCFMKQDHVSQKVFFAAVRPVKDYGGSYIDKDGKHSHKNYMWDDGGRKLCRCSRCGAYYLVQEDEFHGIEDSYYIDCFQMDSEAQAEQVNRDYNGAEITTAYQGRCWRNLSRDEMTLFDFTKTPPHEQS